MGFNYGFEVKQRELGLLEFYCPLLLPNLSSDKCQKSEIEHIVELRLMIIFEFVQSKMLFGISKIELNLEAQCVICYHRLGIELEVVLWC